MRLFPAALLLAAAGWTTWTPAASAKEPDYPSFRKEVQPIFAKSRPGHVRCIVCHSLETNPLHLQAPDDSGRWTEAQSRLNYRAVLREVDPEHPKASRLLLHPLAPEAGGDAFHSGGHQFLSRKDPDWQALAAWVEGKR